MLRLAVAVLLIQAFPGVQRDTLHDLRQITADESVLRNVEIRQTVPGQLTVIHGDGRVVTQMWDAAKSVRLPLLPTCRGTLPTSVVKSVLETMFAVGFLELPQKSYLVLNGDDKDLQDLRMHNIDLSVRGRSAHRGFSAGRYGTEPQQIPRPFVIVEQKIEKARSQAIPRDQVCGVSTAE